MLRINRLNVFHLSRSIAFASAFSLGAMLTLVSAEAAIAKAAAPSTQKIAQKKTTESIWEQLKLDANQKKSLQTIRTNRTKAISAVLNKDQKAKFDQLRPKQRLSDILPQLKLDSQQKSKIAQINQRSQKEFLDVLKPDQKKKLQDYLNRTKQTAE